MTTSGAASKLSLEYKDQGRSAPGSGVRMSHVVLHRAIASPPARAVTMLANIINLKLEIRDVNLMKMEHKSPEFLKLNPMGTVPVIQDGDFVLSESNAIMKYLVEKYGADHREILYPEALQTRALVDQCMFFTAGVFFTALRNVGNDTFMLGIDSPTLKHQADIDNSYGIVDAYLQSRPYIATDRLTLADLSAGAVATAMQTIHKVDKDEFPRCTDWILRLEEEPFFKTINKEGVVMFGKLLNHFWEKNRRKKEQKS